MLKGLSGVDKKGDIPCAFSGTYERGKEVLYTCCQIYSRRDGFKLLGEVFSHDLDVLSINTPLNK